MGKSGHKAMTKEFLSNYNFKSGCAIPLIETKSGQTIAQGLSQEGFSRVRNRSFPNHDEWKMCLKSVKVLEIASFQTS